MLNRNVKWINLGHTDAIESYLEKKLTHLDRFLLRIPEPKETVAELRMTTRHHNKGDIFECEIHLRLPKHTLMASAEEHDIYAAIDKVKDDLERQLIKYKEKPVAQSKRLQID